MFEFNWKWLNSIKNVVQFNQKSSCFRPFSINFDIFSIKFEFRIKFYVWICIVLLQRVNRAAEIGSKKLIERPLKSDSKQNLAQGQSNCVSLVNWHCKSRTTNFWLDLMLSPFYIAWWIILVMMLKRGSHKLATVFN